MEIDYKTIGVIAGIVVVLFTGGLYYIISENRNRQVAFDLVHQYLTASPEQRVALEAQIRAQLEKRPIVLTSRASWDSFEQLLAIAKACEGYAAQATFSPRGEVVNQDEAWQYCMDNPGVLDVKIENPR